MLTQDPPTPLLDHASVVLPISIGVIVLIFLGLNIVGAIAVQFKLTPCHWCRLPMIKGATVCPHCKRDQPG